MSRIFLVTMVFHMLEEGEEGEEEEEEVWTSLFFVRCSRTSLEPIDLELATLASCRVRVAACHVRVWCLVD